MSVFSSCDDLPWPSPGRSRRSGRSSRCSSSSRRACLSPKSKRVSEMDDPLDHALGRHASARRPRRLTPRVDVRRYNRARPAIGSPLDQTIRPDRSVRRPDEPRPAEPPRSSRPDASDPDRSSAASPPRRRRPAPGPRPDLPDRLARRPVGRGAGSSSGSRTSTPPGSAPRPSTAAIDDLRWLGLDWDEGPDVGGPSVPYVQSRAYGAYRDALERLKARRAGLSLHLHPGRHRAGRLGPARRGRGADLPGHLLGPVGRRRRRARAIARSPGGSASRRAGRLGRPVPGPSRGRPVAARRRLRRRPVAGRPVVSARGGRTTTRRWA